MTALRDDNRALKTQVELLERQLCQMQAQLSVEHGMVSGLSMDAAALQVRQWPLCVAWQTGNFKLLILLTQCLHWGGGESGASQGSVCP
jgi:hypothetical protein